MYLFVFELLIIFFSLVTLKEFNSKGLAGCFFSFSFEFRIFSLLFDTGASKRGSGDVANRLLLFNEPVVVVAIDGMGN